MNGGGTSSTPEAPSLVRCRATPKLPAPEIRQSSHENTIARAQLIRWSSSLGWGFRRLEVTNHLSDDDSVGQISRLQINSRQEILV